MSELLALLVLAGVFVAVAIVRRGDKRRSLVEEADVVGRIHAVEQRLAALERAIGATAQPSIEPAITRPPVDRPAPAAPPPARPSDAPPRPPPPQPPARPHGLDLEALIGGKLLNRIGIVAILFAVAFFLKYAFDNDWIGDRGKVAIGFLLGAGLILYSQFLLGRGYKYFSEGIAGLGAAVIDLAIFAGWSFYHLFPAPVAFACMALLTAALVALAVGRNSERIALLALLGGFLTPVLLDTGRNEQVTLFSYLAVLDVALLALVRLRGWRTLELPAFIATQVFFWGWFSAWYRPERLGSTLAFATLFFALFAALPVARARRGEPIGQISLLVILLNAFAYLWTLRELLWPERKWALTGAVLVLAAAHLLVARAARPAPAQAARVRLLFAGLALGFVTLAIPIRLSGAWVTIAWSVEGAILVWSGLRARIRPLRSAGLLLFVFSAVRLFGVQMHADRLLLNPRFAAFATTVLAYGAALHFARRAKAALAPGEWTFFLPLGMALNVFALWALSMEVWDALAPAAVGRDGSLAQQLGLSLLWLLYASGLMALGARRGEPALRWQALALFGLVVLKVFVYDLSSLERIYRIASFVILGVVLLVVSFLYQRRIAAERQKDEP